MKVLAVDFGSKSIGIASGDSVNKVAFPKCVVQNRGDEYVIEEILKICEEGGYKEIVFGLPFDMDGGKGEQYAKVYGFIEKFKAAIAAVGSRGGNLNIVCIDESLSSFEADQYLSDFKGKKIRKEPGDRDIMAAKIILERYFT